MEALPFYFFGVCPDEVGQDSMNTEMDTFKAIDPLFPVRLCWWPLEIYKINIDSRIYWEISTKEIFTFEILRKKIQSYRHGDENTY